MSDKEKKPHIFSPKDIDPDQLKALRGKFLDHATEECPVGSLDSAEFLEALEEILNMELNKKQIGFLFMKIDANSDGRVDWNEYTNYMFISNADISLDQSFQPVFRQKDEDEYSKQNNVEQVKKMDHFHKEKIVKIFYFEKISSYVSISQDGAIMVWKPDTLEYKFSIQIQHFGDAKWIIDATDLQKAGHVCLATMENGMLFFDLNYESEKPIGKIDRSNFLQSAPVTLCSYCDDKSDEDIIFMGDDSGHVHIYKLRHWLWHCCDGEMECHNTPQWTGIVDYHIKDVHTDQITSIHFAPLIESILTSSLDGTCTVISYERKQVKKVFRDHKNAPYDVIWSDSKRCVISGGRDKELLIWNPYSDNVSGSLVGHTSPVMKITYCESLDKLLTLDVEGTIRVWEIKEQKCVQIISGVLTETSAYYYDPKREVLITGFKKLNMYGLLHPTINSNTTTHLSAVVATLYNRYFDQILTCDNIGNILVWDSTTGQIISAYNTNENSAIEDNNEFTTITSCCFDFTGRRLIVGFHTGDAVRIYNFSSGGLITELLKPWSYNDIKLIDNLESQRDKNVVSEVSSLLYIHFPNKTDNEICQIVAGGWDSTLYIWNDTMGESERDGFYRKLPNKRDILDSHTEDVSALCSIPPKYLASGGLDGIIIFWNVWGGSIEARWKLDASIEQLLKKYEILMAARSDGVASIFNVVTLNHLMDIKFYPRGENITCIKACPREDYLVLGDSFGAIKVYKMYDPMQSPTFLQLYSYFQAHDQPITSIDVIDSDEILYNYIISGSGDNNVNIYSLEGSLVATLGQVKEWDYDDRKTWKDDHDMIVDENDMNKPDCPFKDCYSFPSPYFMNYNEDMLEQLRLTKQALIESQLKPQPRDIWYKLADDELSLVICVVKIDYRKSLVIGYDCLLEFDKYGEQPLASIPMGEFKVNKSGDCCWKRNHDLSNKMGMICTEKYKSKDKEDNEIELERKYKIKSVYYNKETKEYSLIDTKNQFHKNFEIRKPKQESDKKNDGTSSSSIGNEENEDDDNEEIRLKSLSKILSRDGSSSTNKKSDLPIIPLNKSNNNNNNIERRPFDRYDDEYNKLFNTPLFAPIPSNRISVPSMALKLNLENKDVKLNNLISCRNIPISMPIYNNISKSARSSRENDENSENSCKNGESGGGSSSARGSGEGGSGNIVSNRRGRIIREKYFKDNRKMQKIDESIHVEFKVLKDQLKLPTIGHRVNNPFL